MTKVSIIGAGRIGRIHALNIAKRPDCKIVYVSDVHKPSADNLAQKVFADTCDAQTAIQSPDIDAVIICSSTDTHAQYCIDASNAGKAIFCEKPLDLDLKRAITTDRHVRQKDVVLALGFNRRFDPTFSALKNGIDSIGQIEQIIITSRDPCPPPHDYVKVSGGLFKDMMIHDFDMARWLLPEEPVRLTAVGRALVDPSISEYDDIDTAMVTLETSGGIQCHIVNSRRAEYGYDQRIEVFGSKGLLRADNQHVNQVFHHTESGCSRSPIQYFFLERYESAYINEINAFIDILNGKKISIPDGGDGVAALRLAEVAKASLRAGCFIDIELD